MATFNGKDGVWRTVGGRHIFIANGQSLKDAMRASGKFDNIIGGKSEKDQYKGESRYKPELLKKAHEFNLKGYDTEEDGIDEFAETEGLSRGEAKAYLDKAKHNYLHGKSMDDDNALRRIQEANRQNRLKTAKANAEASAKEYQKYYNDYKKYADKANTAGYGTPEYEKYAAKRSEAHQKAMEAKEYALTEFHKTIPYDEMFEAGKQVSGSKSAVFGEPELVNKNGSFYVHYSSNDIKADAGVFSSVLKGARLENFNSELYIDKQTGELTYWGSMDIRYQHNDGGSNGMKIMDYRYKQSTGWDITDSAGYKYKNGKKITTVSGLTNYYMEYYGYSKENAKKMAEASLDDVHRRESMINY